MKYLLDTCVVSELMKAKPNSTFLRWISEQDEFSLAISALTLGELTKGVYLLPESKKKSSISIWLLETLSERFMDRILSVSDEVAARWGSLAAQAIKRGTPLPVIDSLLLATADIHQLAIVTRNTTDFEGFNVKVINPWN